MSPAKRSAGSHEHGGALWDAHADWWQASFTNGADIEYEEEVLPFLANECKGARQILDLGCGEGQVARRLAQLRGARVVGIDPSAGQLGHAIPHARKVRYVQGTGECLPFVDGSFDAVVCCLVIEHTADPDVVLEEVARVLAPGGRFLLLINHPMYQGPNSGMIDDQILGERYWRVGPYLAESTTIEHVDAEVEIPFSHRPLSRYINPLVAFDLLLTKLWEPAPLPAFLEDSIDPDLEGAIPRLLAMRFEHRPRPEQAGASGKKRMGQ